MINSARYLLLSWYTTVVQLLYVARLSTQTVIGGEYLKPAILDVQDTAKVVLFTRVPIHQRSAIIKPAFSVLILSTTGSSLKHIVKTKFSVKW